ncbi:MAG: Nif11-like leader peptide family RiPP precursor [Peptostreptococcaceae bacterium]|nr:Nif11-like leader peptide family RiPP precursor [Peptostreptococcaceae bacterium]
MNEIERFNKNVVEDVEMMTEVKAIGNDMDKIVAFANDKGYAFTVADLKAQTEKDGELSENQLDEVSGGLSCIITGVVDMTAVLVL